MEYTPGLMELIESAGRVCYKSEDRICEGSADKLIASMMSKHHMSVIEHVSITVRIICDRGISHELVRHRMASFSQESTRYCNYDKNKFGNEITVIDILGGFPNMTDRSYTAWIQGCESAEREYFNMLRGGSTAQEARSVLPNSLKTELVVSANAREWRHIFELRCASSAHPQIREIMIPLKAEFAKLWPVLFADAI